MTPKKCNLDQWAREHLEDELMDSIKEIEVKEVSYSFSMTSTDDGKVKMTCRGHISASLSTKKATLIASGFIFASAMLLTSLIEQVTHLPTQIGLLVNFFT